MERYDFFRQLGKAVYQIGGAYSVFSKNARIKPNMLCCSPLSTTVRPTSKAKSVGTGISPAPL